MKIYHPHNIYYKLGWTILILLLSLLLIPRLAAQDNDNSLTQDTLVLEYYTGIGCPSCKKIDGLIKKIDDKYEFVAIRTYEVYRNKENFKKMIDTYNSYGIGWDRHWVPVIFFEDFCLVGYTEIESRLENEILNELKQSQ